MEIASPPISRSASGIETFMIESACSVLLRKSSALSLRSLRLCGSSVGSANVYRRDAENAEEAQRRDRVNHYGATYPELNREQ